MSKLLDEWIASAGQIPILGQRQRTSIIARIKFGLGGVVLLLLLSLVLWPLLYPVDQPLKLNFNAVDSAVPEPKTMIKPRFHGMDKHNRPFNIRADQASQKSENVVVLKTITGDMAMEDGRWLMLEATEGEAETKKRLVELRGNVKIFASDGHEITSPLVSLDMNTATAKSERPIQMQGPLGILQGEGFFLDVNEEKLNIKGRVHLRIYPQRG